MKRIYTLAIIMLFVSGVRGQYFNVTNFSGTTYYGTFGVTVTSGGSVTTYADPCLLGPTSYWIGELGAGWYTYTFSRPVFSIYSPGEGLNTDEYLQLYVNGSPYTLTPANIISYTSCGSGGPCYLSTGWLYGPTSGYNAGELSVSSLTGITSVEFYCNGIASGIAYHFEIDTVFPFQAVSNTPCAGDTLKLDAIGDSLGATYSWTGPLGFTSTSQDPFIYPATLLDAGVYTVVRFDSGSFDTSTVDVIIHPKPVVIASSNAPLCAGLVDTLHLSVVPDSTGETFSWTGPDGFTSTLQFPFIDGFSAADVGNYTVIATSSYGCKDTGATNVILAPVPPAPVVTGITSYCQNATFVPFTVTGYTGTLLWYATGVGGVGSGTAPVVNTAVPGTYTYWVTQTILGCESNRASITVVVHPTPPAPTVTGTTEYCQYAGPFVPLTVSAAPNSVPYWFITAAGGDSSLTEPPVNINLAGTGTYNYYFWISQTDTADGCESPRAPVTITVNPKPIPPVVIDSPQNYCPGETFEPFTVVSGINVTWYATAAGGGASGVAPGINTTIPGSDTVWVSQTTAAGCISDTAPYVVTVYNKVTAGFDDAIHYGCHGDTVLFTNTSTGAINYSWNFGDISPVNISEDPTHVYLLQGNYTVKLYASSANCIDSSIQPLSLVHPLLAQFSADTNLICQGGSVTFTNASVATPPPGYLWNFGDGVTSSSINPTHLYPHTGVYKAYLVVSDFVPCYDTAYETISVDTTSPIYLSITDSVLCTGTYLTFSGNYSSIGNTGITWNFGNGDSIRNINPVSFAYQDSGSYTITASVTYRVCSDTSASRTIRIEPQPAIFIGADTAICAGGNPITLEDRINAGNTAAAWKWSTGATLPAITITAAGNYSCTVKIDGCSASASVTVKNNCYMDIPNVFSPNGDGINDYFYPRQELASGLASFSMEIYNRWGQQVFATTSLDGRGWDGRLNGIDEPEGVYVYIIDASFVDGQQEHHQGNVTLIR